MKLYAKSKNCVVITLEMAYIGMLLTHHLEIQDWTLMLNLYGLIVCDMGAHIEHNHFTF